MCPRKWAFIKIDGLEAPPNAAAALGLRVHDVLELFLGEGEDIDTDTEEGQIAFPGVRLLPVPRYPGMRLEGWFAIQFGAAAYVGYKDVEIIRAGERPQVKDHKTTRSFTWMKTQKELLRDVQAGLYAADSMIKTGWSEVELEWIYYRTEGSRQAKPVQVTINREQVSRILTGVDETAREMIAIKESGVSAIDVTPDYSGCSKFGGCPFRGKQCKVSGSKLLRALFTQKGEETARMSGKTESFLSGLKDRKKKRSGGKGKSESKKAKERKVDVEDVEEAQQVNPGEREEAQQPPPPNPKKVGNEWIQPVWNPDAWEWEYPEGTEKAEKAEKAAKKKNKKGEKGKKSKSPKDILDRSKKKQEEPEDIEEEGDEEESGLPEERIAGSSTEFLDDLLDDLAERVAQRVAEKLSE